METLVTMLILLAGLALLALLAVIVWPLTFERPRPERRPTADVRRFEPRSQPDEASHQRAA